MDERTERRLQDVESTLIVGLLSLAVGPLSLLIYETSGHWPADLGGWELVLFATLGIGLVGYSRWTP